MTQAKNIKEYEKVECPKCKAVQAVNKRSNKPVVCPECQWSGGMDYPNG